VTRLIYDLKYHARPDIGRHMGFIMARQMGGAGFFEGIDAMMPMPLSRWRQWHRGYNQSEQIALGISEATGIPVLSKVVRRKHFIVSQTHLNRWERQANTADAFVLLQPDRIRGCHLLLVDDIVTTGATLTALATELQQAGDVRISIVSFGYSKSL
jgi:ComF family protein